MVTTSMLINNNIIRANKELKKIQHDYNRSARKIKTKNLKFKLGKFVKLLPHENEYINLAKNQEQEVVSEEQFKLKAKEFESREKIISSIKSNNVIGMSGDCFSLATKLQTVFNATKSIVDTNGNTVNKLLLINAIECEPSLMHDTWLLNNYTESISRAISILKNCGFDKIIIAAKAPASIEKIGDYNISYVANRYPMGSEHVLINELTGFTIPSNDIPANYGVAVVNVQTVLSFYNSIFDKTSYKGRFITVANMTKDHMSKEGNAVVCYVPYGMKISEVMSNVFPKYSEKNGVLVSGGGLLFGHIAKENEIVEEGTCFIGYVNEIAKLDSNNDCKMCGKCKSVCPMKLKVTKITHAYREGNLEKARSFEMQKCIQCGSCTFVCKANKDLMSVVAKVKESY